MLGFCKENELFYHKNPQEKFPRSYCKIRLYRIKRQRGADKTRDENIENTDKYKENVFGRAANTLSFFRNTARRGFFKNRTPPRLFLRVLSPLFPFQRILQRNLQIFVKKLKYPLKTLDGGGGG